MRVCSRQLRYWPASSWLPRVRSLCTPAAASASPPSPSPGARVPGVTPVQDVRPPMAYDHNASGSSVRVEPLPEAGAALGEGPLGQHAFAVVALSGKQYKVVPGDRLTTERLAGARVGQRIALPKVLLVGTPEVTAVGRPVLPNVVVHATVEEQRLADKVIIFKKKRRQGYRRRRGHRQAVTVLHVEGITVLPPQQHPAASILEEAMLTEE